MTKNKYISFGIESNDHRKLTPKISRKRRLAKDQDDFFILCENPSLLHHSPSNQKSPGNKNLPFYVV